MDSVTDVRMLDEFVAICGAPMWRERLAALRLAGRAATRQGKQSLQYHCIELVVERARGGAGGRTADRPVTGAERAILGYAADAAALHRSLRPAGRERLRSALGDGLAGARSLVPMFHMLRTAALQRSRGFEVSFEGFEDGAPFDLLITRGGAEAEIACDVMSAEDGRGVHRGAWFDLVDRIDPELQTWLRAHPGRYLLKLTLPLGLKLPEQPDRGLLPVLHERITQMLSAQKRADGDEAAVLRLDPLMLAAAQADELGLMPRLREEFGPEAHLAVTASGGGLFVMAARAGQQNDVAAAVRRRLSAVAPARLTGTRPGILAMFIEDTDRLEWRLLRERLELEGETRQFLTHPEAKPVIAVTCSSRLELFGIGEPDGELRFRNQAHPAAKSAELAPAVASSM